MKLIHMLTLLLGAVSFVNTAYAAGISVPVAEVSKPKVAVTSHLSASNKYLGFGAGIELSQDAVIQSDINFGFDNGLYVFIWASTSLDNNYGKTESGTLDFGDEIDLGIGWAGQVNGFSVDVGTTYFDEPSIGSFGANDVLYTHLRIGKTFALATLAMIWENYWALPNSPIGGGNLIGLEVSKAFKLSENFSAPLMAGAVYDDGGFGTGTGILIRGAATISYKQRSNTSLDGGCRWYVPTMNDYRKTNTVWWAGVTYKF